MAARCRHTALGTGRRHARSGTLDLDLDLDRQSLRQILAPMPCTPPLPPPTSSTSSSTTVPTVGMGSPRSPPKPTPVSPRLTTLRATGAPRRSSISLAELTSPYNTDPRPHPPPPAQPKNSNAQTKAPPGHRLRTAPEGPAIVEASPPLRIHIVDTRKQVPV